MSVLLKPFKGFEMNHILAYDEGLVNSIRVNKSEVEDRARTLATRRTFKMESQAAAYLCAVQCVDLTTLAGDDTPGRVQRLCSKALRPVEPELIKKLGLEDFHPTVGAVCVYPAMVEWAVKFLNGRLPVASVATGFPAGQIPSELKIAEIKYAIDAGATEIDVVISRGTVFTGQWEKLYDELVSFRLACGNQAKMKTILGVGDLKTLDNIAKASAVAIMAGSDFIKTSTGFEPTNATLEAGLVMARQIRRFQEIIPGLKVGFKPAGGIRTAKDAQAWLILMLEELGDEWTRPELFRIGASTLLTDLERQLWHLATGRYSAEHHHPMG